MQSWTFFNSYKLLDVVSYFVHIISSKTFAALCVWPHNKALVLTLEIKLPNGFRFLKLMEFNEFKKKNLRLPNLKTTWPIARPLQSLVSMGHQIQLQTGARVSLEFLPPKMQASENKIIASFSSHVPEILFLT